ncbi:hypothetical protein J0A78_10610 [Providencia rettgeri]|nr:MULTISPECIES: hypothetical protein [Providencia]MBN7840882.1 hypothetical protein [Providencia rettgeri]MBN7855026.1 hypothetical protein [Providencia rettgeri]MBN7860965.1 hypothetical protein [Providencia rettgeri]MBN7871692.1 hypothetical protein [Providencia rettgeri]MBN7897303.1 hypothetical protein [Providencia rettgeri]
MSDKKEIATLSIKISVDSTDLDKLEAQLKRIERLMISTGLKQPTSVGFSADMFFVTNGQVFIDAPLITSGTINSAKIQGPAIDDALRRAAKEVAKKGIEQARFEITTGINDNREQQSAEVTLKASAEISRTSEVISREQSEFEKFKQQVESEFSQLQASITAIQQTIVDSDRAIAENLRQLNLKLCGRTVR